MRSWIAGAVLALIPALTQAQSYQAVNRLQVVPLGGGDLEVIEARGEGARGIWCAAADYLVHQGLTRPGQRLYVKRARGASVSGQGRVGVSFTTDPARLSVQPSQSVTVSVRTPGQSLSVQHAYRFCRDYIIDEDDILFWRNRG